MELAAMILDRCRQAGLTQLESVDVSPSKTEGWEATYTAPKLLYVLYTPQFGQIVRQLREQFDLAE
jgi:hypothetical protein